MNMSEAMALGVLQGLTEFLPVSSSGHLFLVQKFWGFTPNRALEIWLHLGSLLAVMLFFKKDILHLLRGMGNMLRQRKTNKQGSLGFQLALATIATVPVALFIESKGYHHLTLPLAGISFLVTALLIWGAETFRAKRHISFSWMTALALGIVQGFAVLPGISRSGITIGLLIFLGLNRKKSAEISFLLAIPTIIGAVVFAAKDLVVLEGQNAALFLVSGLMSFIASLLALRWMMQWIQHKWLYFAPYCLLVGLLLLSH